MLDASALAKTFFILMGALVVAGCVFLYRDGEGSRKPNYNTRFRGRFCFSLAALLFVSGVLLVPIPDHYRGWFLLAVAVGGAILIGVELL